MANYLNIFEKEQSRFIDNRVNYNPDSKIKRGTTPPSLRTCPTIHRAGSHNKTTQPNPLSLDGRGIKGEGENDALHRPNPGNPDSDELPCLVRKDVTYRAPTLWILP